MLWCLPGRHLAWREHTLTGRRQQARLASNLLRWLIVAAFLAAFAVYIRCSLHWRMAIDSPVMHYVVFLLHHGLRPYVEISDNNLPGAYFTEAVAMRVFGAGDLGWRLYEFFLLAFITAAMAFLERSRDWVAALFSGLIFVSLHSAEGPQYAGERELVITALLLLGYGSLFAAMRRGQPRLMLWVGLAGGLATSIKPTYLPFTLLFLATAAVVARRQTIAVWPYLGWALAGLLAVGAACLGFLVRYHVVGDFLFLLRHVLPTYAGLAPPSWSLMFQALLPRSLKLLALLTLPVAAANWRRDGPWSWECVSIGLGALLAFASFLAQRKGFFHHRYAFVLLLFLLVGAELLTALRNSGWPRLLSAALILYVLFGYAPRLLRLAASLPPETAFYAALQADLQHLGGPSQLQDKVQCFDLVYGCLNVLYHERIVENTGFTGDLLFFAPKPSLARDYYRTRFWQGARQDPASVLVVSNQTLLQTNSYGKLDAWPEFKSYLDRDYILAVQRNFPLERFTLPQKSPDQTDEDSYRLYLRKGSPLLTRLPALQGTATEPALR